MRASRVWLCGALLLVVVTLVAYRPALEGGYIWDDDRYVTENVELRSPKGLERIWFDPSATVQYYPLVHSSFWIQHRMDDPLPGEDPDPFPFHLVNVLLHAANALLLWALLRALGLPFAWLGAALFALHPVHVESVAWITERKNVLSGLFALGAALAYVRFAGLSSRPRGGIGWYAAALVLFLLALLSKTVVAMLPGALLLVLWWRRGFLTRRDVMSLLPMFALGLAAGLFTAFLEKHQVGAQGPAFDLSFLDRVLIAGRALWFYAGKLVWPAELTFVYRRWSVDAVVWWQWLYPLGAGAALTALWLWRRRLGRGPLVAACVFAGVLFPALGFIDVFPMQYSFVADHFQYHASIVLIAACAGGLGRLGAGWRRWRRGLLVAGAGALLLVLGGLTWQQAHIYRDAPSVWRDTLRKNPGATLALNNLGVWLAREGELHAARDLLQRSLDVDAEQPRGHENYANVLSDLGLLDEAIVHYRQALALAPQFGEDRRTMHLNLGLAYRKKGMLEEAIDQFERGRELAFWDPRLHYALGEALLAAGRRGKAERAFREALRRSGADVQIRDRAERILRRLGAEPQP